MNKKFLISATRRTDSAETLKGFTVIDTRARFFEKFQEFLNPKESELNLRFLPNRSIQRSLA